MNILLQHLLGHLVRRGNLVVSVTGGERSFGDGTGEPVHVVIHTRHAQRAIALDPLLGFPEMFMAGEVDFLKGDSLALMKLIYANTGLGGVGTGLAKAVDSVRGAFRRLQQINTPLRARRNVAAHYDLSDELYRLFLDDDMQYSCAYFERPDMTLEEAQLAKKRHIAAKLQLKPGQNVLDIGCGWGGMALYLARRFEVDVLGVTLSEEQLAVATDRAHAERLDRRVHFELKDYRHLSERFDRIVSVGMFEHVGINHYQTFFDKAATLLKPDGVMLLHTIGRIGPPVATAAFIRKHVFPGGYIPSLSEVLPAIERAGLMTSDVEILRLHYAETLRHWRERFMAKRERAVEIYDERFCRMWEFYLACSEAAFRWQDLVVFQIQLTKRNDSLPLTRGYMEKCEKAMALHEVGHGETKIAVSARNSAKPKRRRQKDA